MLPPAGTGLCWYIAAKPKGQCSLFFCSITARGNFSFHSNSPSSVRGSFHVLPEPGKYVRQAEPGSYSAAKLRCTQSCPVAPLKISPETSWSCTRWPTTIMRPVFSSFRREYHAFKNQSSTVPCFISLRFCSIGCGSSINKISPPSPLVPAHPTPITLLYPVFSFSNFL